MCLAQGHFSRVDGSQNRGLDPSPLAELCSLSLSLPPSNLQATPNIGFGSSQTRRWDGSLVTRPRNYILVLTPGFIWSDLKRSRGSGGAKVNRDLRSCVWDA